MDSDSWFHTQFLLQSISKPTVCTNCVIPFSPLIGSDPPPDWFDRQIAGDIAICAHGIYVIYFYITSHEPNLTCALFLNDHEIAGTRCRDSLFGSTIILPTAPNPKCRITLQLIDFETLEIAPTIQSGYFLICKLA